MCRLAFHARGFVIAVWLAGFAPSVLFAFDPPVAESSADLFGLMYWTDRNEGINRASRDGSEVQLVVATPSVDGLAVDEKEGKLYFTVSAPQQQTGDKVMRTNLDGSNPQELSLIHI